VEDVARQYTAIYSGGKPDGTPFVLVKQTNDKHALICVTVEPDDDGQYYDVTTGFVARDRYLKRKKLLWSKPPEEPSNI
jgi:hypothetical protein